MGKKRPIELGPLRREKKERRGWPLAIIALFALAVAGIVAALIFFGPGPAQQGDGGKISVYLQGPSQVTENAPVKVSAFSSCGVFSTFLDGKVQQQGVLEAEAIIRVPPGTHVFEAKNGNCSGNVSFSVVAPQCSGGQVQQCNSEGCPGTETCFGGNWGDCVLPRKVCSPGQKIGCSLDGCHFGYSACNQCGSGFGPCMPENSSAPQAQACSGDTCG
jgi:hypothetical protein